MISYKTRELLHLVPRLKSACEPLFHRLVGDYENEGELEEAIGWWSKDYEKLNDVWWTLNYNSVKLDPDRKLRALIEQMLDSLV